MWSCTISCGCCYRLNSPSYNTPFPAFLLYVCFMILVREPNRPTLRAMEFPCFPIIMPFFGDSPHFQCFLLLYVSVNLTSFQKPSSSIPFSRRSSLILPPSSVVLGQPSCTSVRVSCYSRSHFVELNVCPFYLPSPAEHFLRTDCQSCIPLMHVGPCLVENRCLVTSCCSAGCILT